MPSRNPLPTPDVAVRGSVQKTFVENRILAGFTDDNHFRLIAGEFLDSLSKTDRDSVLNAAENARAYVRSLAPLTAVPTEIRPISHEYINQLRTDPVFQAAFGQTSHRFMYVNPRNIVALQAWVEPRSDAIPNTEEELLHYVFPNKWEVPAEISFLQPNGPIQILSSNPAFHGVTMDFDSQKGSVNIGPPKHLNLVQVMHFQGKYYLRNGYHRMTDAVRANLNEYPCIIIDALSPMDLQLAGPTFFAINYIFGLPRPPLVMDFHSNAAIDTKVRERRYGMIINLDIKPLNIGI